MTLDEILIPYDAQCPHGLRFSDCQICSGARDDFERDIYEREDERESNTPFNPPHQRVM